MSTTHTLIPDVQVSSIAARAKHEARIGRLLTESEARAFAMGFLAGTMKGLDIAKAELPATPDRICPCCGVKHQGPWQACSSCKAAMDRGE